jgi:hypothetical protein
LCDRKRNVVARINACHSACALLFALCSLLCAFCGGY